MGFEFLKFEMMLQPSQGEAGMEWDSSFKQIVLTARHLHGELRNDTHSQAGHGIMCQNGMHMHTRDKDRWD